MIDLIASQPQYAAHLGPVWDALSAGVRGAGDAALVSSYADLATAQRRGYRRIAYLEHGIGQSYGNGHPGYPGGRKRDAVGLFLSPNETAAALDRAAYPKARVEVVGDPRLDTLPALETDTGTVCVSFHWRCDVAPETRTTFDYYKGTLADLAGAVPLIVHAHPRIQAEVARFGGRLGIEFVPSFDDVCRRASLYVCDNSSTIYEFASTGRPVVVLNHPTYRRDREMGLRFWAAATVGLQVNEPSRLVANVEVALRDQRELQIRRNRALRIAYAYRSGAGQRAAAVIEDWLADVAVVA